MKTTGLNSWKSWGIAVLCSLVNFLCLLPIRISGLIFVALMESYSVSRKTASQPITVATIVRCMIGPLTGYLCGLFGIRSIIVCGAILCSFGLGACFYAEDMTYIIISIGLVYGIGLAFGNTLIPMVIKQHFDKHASKANGVSLIGCCVNAIIIPPIFQYLLMKYGTAGACLITSGIMLNGLPAAILLKNPNYISTSQAKRKSEEEPLPLNEISQVSNDSTSAVNRREEVVTHPERDDFTSTLIYVYKSQCDEPFQVKKNETQDNISAQLDLKLSIENSKCRNNVNNTFHKSDEVLNHGHDDSIGQEEYQLGSPQLNSSSNKDDEHKSLCEMLKVFIDPSYLIILISQGCQPFFLCTIWTIIIDLSRDKGIPGNLEIYFLMLLPVSELIGYIGLAWVTDNGYLSTTKFCVVCYVSTALSIVGLVWSYNFVTMAIAILLFSFFGAAVTTISPVVIYEFIEEKRQAMAMASRFMLFVPLGLATPSLIGYFRENLGSYDWLLYLLALSSLLCGLLYILMPFTLLYKKRKRNS